MTDAVVGQRALLAKIALASAFTSGACFCVLGGKRASSYQPRLLYVVFGPCLLSATVSVAVAPCLLLGRLLFQREIKKLEDKIGQKGFTVVPLKVYFNDDNRLKVELALAQGKNVRDKREDVKDRDAKRDLHRIAKNAY